ncbi:hypothetical protein [Candidatus Palauibacter sp.]|uniref:hypothetical protein n=1 Tax=Candidatus Palauibacter sp. TaxID=3101350 RepID=UPI003B019751
MLPQIVSSFVTPSCLGHAEPELFNGLKGNKKTTAIEGLLVEADWAAPTPHLCQPRTKKGPLRRRSYVASFVDGLDEVLDIEWLTGAGKRATFEHVRGSTLQELVQVARRLPRPGSADVFDSYGGPVSILVKSPFALNSDISRGEATHFLTEVGREPKPNISVPIPMKLRSSLVPINLQQLPFHYCGVPDPLLGPGIAIAPSDPNLTDPISVVDMDSADL